MQPPPWPRGARPRPRPGAMALMTPAEQTKERRRIGDAGDRGREHGAQDARWDRAGGDTHLKRGRVSGTPAPSPVDRTCFFGVRGTVTRGGAPPASGVRSGLVGDFAESLHGTKRVSMNSRGARGAIRLLLTAHISPFLGLLIWPQKTLFGDPPPIKEVPSCNNQRPTKRWNNQFGLPPLC